MKSLYYTVLIVFIVPFVSSKDADAELRKEACRNNSCHPLTQCHAVSKKKEGSDKLIYEPVCVSVPTCSSIKCEKGAKCSMKEIRCQLSPCFRIPTCLPDIDDALPEFQMPPALLI